VVEVQCLLDATGAYTLTAADAVGDKAGGYGIHLQRTNAPVNATAINFGGAGPGTLDLPAEVEAYSFSGAAGDKILLRMARSSGDIQPRAYIYRPDGTVLCGSEGLWFTETPCVLDATGTHAFLAAGANGFSTGAYGVEVQRTSGPGNAAPL